MKNNKGIRLIMLYLLLCVLCFNILAASAAEGDIVFEEGFEDGNFNQNWTTENGSYAVVDGKELDIDNNTYVLKVTKKNLITLNNHNFTNFSYEARIYNTLSRALPSLVFRVHNSKKNYYMFRINLGTPELYRASNGNLSSVSANIISNYAMQANEWYTLKVIVNGDTIAGYVDGQKVLEYIDDNPYLEGGIGIRNGNNETSYYDDLIVRELIDEPADSGELIIENVVFEDGNGNSVNSLTEVTPDSETSIKSVKGIVHYNNSKQSEQQACIIIALYKNGVLEKIEYNENVTVPAQTSEYSDSVTIEIPDNIEGYSIKLFNWNSMDGMQPLQQDVNILQ